MKSIKPQIHSVEKNLNTDTVVIKKQPLIAQTYRWIQPQQRCFKNTVNLMAGDCFELGSNCINPPFEKSTFTKDSLLKEGLYNIFDVNFNKKVDFCKTYPNLEQSGDNPVLKKSCMKNLCTVQETVIREVGDDQIQDSSSRGFFQNNKTLHQAHLSEDVVHNCIIDMEEYLGEKVNSTSSMRHQKHLQPNDIDQQVNRFVYEETMSVLLVEIPVFDGRTLTEMITALTNQAKAVYIKSLLNTLLSELDNDRRLPKPRSVGNFLPKSSSLPVPVRPADRPPQLPNMNDVSLTDIVQLYNDVASHLESDKAGKASCGATPQTNKKQLSYESPANRHKVNCYNLSYQHLIQMNKPFKVLIMNPFDEVIKSYLSVSDRRLIAIAKKVNVQISIYGPIKAMQMTVNSYVPRDKTMYHCVIVAEQQVQIGKCLKCMRDTFPTMTLREVNFSCNHSLQH